MAVAATVVTPAPFVVLRIAVTRSARASYVVGGVGSAGRVAGATGAGSIPGGECLVGVGLGVVLLAEFLKDEKQSSTLEGMRRKLGGDHRLEVAIARAKATE
jgi:hypothetical protein